jgi:hypothetical protein
MIEANNWLTKKLENALVAMTPRCKDITRLLSAAQDRQLSLRERLQVRLHFVICVWCERYGEQLRFLRRRLREAPEHSHEMGCGHLTLEARERIKKTLREQSPGV